MGMPSGVSSSRGSKEFSGNILSSKYKRSNSSFVTIEKTLPNPKPDNYKIIRHEYSGEKLVIEIQYLDCTNYEGRKILVFECTLEQLEKQKLIDPHFCENKNFISPIARFEPTEKGWNNAIKFASLT